MRKVTKILAKTLSAMILLLIILPLMLSLALTLPVVQNFAVQQFTQFASTKIGSRVEVGSVSFSMLQEFTLYDVMVEDLSGEMLLSAAEIQARISNFSLLGKALAIESIKAKDGSLRLREMPDSIMNIKQIVDKITNEEKEKVFRTTILNFEVENLDFSLERLERKNPEYGVDLGYIVFEGVNAKGSNAIFQGGISEFAITQMEGREQSGFEIFSFSSQITTYQGVLDFVNLRARSSSSRLYLPRVRLESDSWAEYKLFNSNVGIELVSAGSTLSLSDVAYFAPELQGNKFEMRSLTTTLNGTVDNFEMRVDNLTFGSGSHLVARAEVVGVDNFESSTFVVNVNSLKSDCADVESLLGDFNAKKLPTKAREMLTALGSIQLISQVRGSVENLNIESTLRTAIGQATYVGAVKGARSKIDVSGVATTSNFNLGKLLSNQSLGSVSLVSEVRYNTRGTSLDAALKGNINSIEYNSCKYSTIALDASYDGEIVEGVIKSEDEKFNFNLSGLVNLGEQRHYDLTMRVRQADLHAMAINTRDSISTISGSLRVNLGGNTLDDLSGSVTLRNVAYRYNEESLYAPTIALTARNNKNNKRVELKSDFIDVSFNSKSSYTALYNYVSDGMRTYIPILYTQHTERDEQQKRMTKVDNYSTLTVDFKNISQLSPIISSGLNVADSSSFNIMVNPYSERFSMRLESDYISHNKFAATDLSINASNDSDSLSLYATAADIFMGRTSFSSYTLTAGVRNNTVELSTGFRDQPSQTSATLGMEVKFDSVQRANILLRPSNITMGDDVWMISADNIRGTDNQLEVNNFEMVNGGQRLTLNGVASTIPSDSLVLKLDNYDISMITSVINNLGYSVEGLSNGYVNMRELFTNPRIVADVKLDSVAVNSIPSPALSLNAGWSATENRAGVFVTNRHNRDTVVRGYYVPQDGRYLAHLKVDSLDMRLIDPLLKTTITDTRGFANVDVSLQGKGKEASLHGGLYLYDLSTRIIYTQVEYSIPSAYVSVDDNQLRSEAQLMYDTEGNSGLVTLNLSLDHLSNVSYMLRVVPENMMVLNTTEQDNELFYGTLFATGVATIEGDRRGVNMDITATSNANSSFFMPLSTKSAVTKTDFITFVQPDEQVEAESSGTINFRRAFITERQRLSGNQNSGQVNINMALHATPDLDFQLVIDPVVGDIIKAKGEGRLNLNIAPQENLFEMYGDYNITEGNYLFTLLNPISKRFIIDSGSSIQWTGDPIDPQLNIDAVYKVKTSLDPLINSTSDYSSETSSRSVPVDCIIHLGDRLSQPSVTFSIDVPTADTEQQAVIANTLIDQETISQQFFYLMIANSFIPVSSSYGSGLTGTTTASTGFELLTNQLSNWLSSTNYDVVIRYRPGSDTELTSNEVDVGFSRGLIDNRLLIEVEGNYLADNAYSTDDSDLSNFMGEAYITWLIDKEGALRLKGFSQTIDRYDENQGLQETGIGVYFSESFENFQDLKRKIRDRFRRKNKSE